MKKLVKYFGLPAFALLIVTCSFIYLTTNTVETKLLLKHALNFDSIDEFEIINHKANNAFLNVFIGKNEEYTLRFKENKFLHLIEKIEKVGGWKPQNPVDGKAKAWERIAEHERAGLISIVRVSGDINSVVTILFYEY
jgi:hypothetical protein